MGKEERHFSLVLTIILVYSLFVIAYTEQFTEERLAMLASRRPSRKQCSFWLPLQSRSLSQFLLRFWISILLQCHPARATQLLLLADFSLCYPCLTVSDRLPDHNKHSLRQLWGLRWSLGASSWQFVLQTEMQGSPEAITLYSWWALAPPLCLLVGVQSFLGQVLLQLWYSSSVGRRTLQVYHEIWDGKVELRKRRNSPGETIGWMLNSLSKHRALSQVAHLRLGLGI